MQPISAARSGVVPASLSSAPSLPLVLNLAISLLRTFHIYRTLQKTRTIRAVSDLSGHLLGICAKTMRLSYIFYRQGNTYVGEARSGIPHGQGRLNSLQGGYREGNFVNGTFQRGHGRIVHADGGKYEGELRGDTPHGFGMTYDRSGEIVEAGHRVEGERHGFGIDKQPDGSVRIGHFSKDTFIQGYGERFSSRVEGRQASRLGFAHDHCVYVYLDAQGRELERHKNIAVRGLSQGWGVCTATNGYMYVGDHAAGKVHGQGYARSVTKRGVEFFKGTFENGVMHGQGRLTTLQGEYREGNFVNGTFQRGHGRRFTTDGGKYEGELRGDTPHGFGMTYDRSGEVIEAGYQVNGQPQGFWLRKEEGGSVFIGQVQGDKVVCGYGEIVARVGGIEASCLGIIEAGVFNGPCSRMELNTRHQVVERSKGMKVGGEKQGWGVTTMINEDIYVGNYVADEPYGLSCGRKRVEGEVTLFAGDGAYGDLDGRGETCEVRTGNRVRGLFSQGRLIRGEATVDGITETIVGGVSVNNHHPSSESESSESDDDY